MEEKFQLSNIGTRKEIRDKLVMRFLEFPCEIFEPIYLWVEEKDGYSIYLTCPGPRNKGVDFIANMEGYTFYNENGRRAKNPTHPKIVDDLQQKKAEDKEKYNQFFKTIVEVFECKTEADTDIKFNSGIPADLLLKLLKWLFIEQDVTYWTKSGRNMLMNYIKDEV